MFTQELKKISILSLRRNKPWLIGKLQEAGVMHLREIPLSEYAEKKLKVMKPEDHYLLSKLSAELLKLKWINDTLKKYYEGKEPEFDTLTRKRLDELFIASVELRRALEEELETKLGLINELKKQVKEKEEILSVLKELNPDQELTENISKEYLNIFFKIFIKKEINDSQKEKFEKELRKKVKERTKAITILNQGKTYLIIGLKENEEEIIEVINSLEGQIIPFTDEKTINKINKENNPLLTQKKLEQELFRLRIRITNTENSLRVLAKSFYEEGKKIENDLEIFYSRYSINDKLIVTKNAFLLEGYIPKKETKKLNDLKKDPYLVLTEEKAKEGPTKLTEKPYFKHFSFFTELFGYPKYGKIDPTYFIGLFFPLFFGFMFSDIGYGIMLLIFAQYIKQKTKGIRQGEDFSYVLTVSALYTILFGFLFGSFFGNLIKITPLWIDPFKKSLLILITALAIGLIHLNLGIILSIIEKIKEKKYLAAITDPLGIILLELAGAAYTISLKGIIPTTYGHTLLAASVITLIIKGGAFGVTEITGFAGIWLSYARILALSLATGGIALAMNIMAQKLGAIPLIGIILFWSMIIIGHLFNFLINLLGSTIHSIRLHYVEFFSQFYEADGEPFKPFTIRKEKKLL